MSYDKLLNNLKKTATPEKKTEQATTSNKIGIMEIKAEGTYRIRILPSLKDPDDVPFVEVMIHLGFTHPNYGKIVPLLCLGEKECPACAFHKKKKADKDKSEWKYKPNKRFIYYAINEDGNLVMLSLHWYVHEAIRQKLIAQLKAGVNIMDMLEGRWLDVIVKKINDKFTYTVAVDSEEHKVPRNLRERYENLKPLEEVYEIKTRDELKKIVRGEKLDIKPKSNKTRDGFSNDDAKEESDDKHLKKLDQKVDKKLNPEDMKFASDMVDSIDDDVMKAAEDDDMSNNMRRLDDILKRTDDSGELN